jgi:DNA-binding IclR family transcriptional regulator
MPKRKPDTKWTRGGQAGDRLLAALGLFTVDRPMWTVEEAAQQIGVSTSSAYRYFKNLTKAGLITPVSRAAYMLGPGIIKLDRQLQISDPLLQAAREVMDDLVIQVPNGSTLLLCRLFHDGLICVHQVRALGPQPRITYERGASSPLLRGATARVILAHLSSRVIQRIYKEHSAEFAEVNLGDSWPAVRRSMAEVRRAGFAVSHGEIDPERVCIAAPVFDLEGKVLAALGLSVLARQTNDALLAELTPLVIAAARRIEDRMARLLVQYSARPRRLRA